MEEGTFDKNMSNSTKVENTLFGEVKANTSMKERLGFLPISIWKPDWQLTKQLKDWVSDTGQTRKVIKYEARFLGAKNTVSIFNPHLALMILAAYAPEKAKIFDPYGGGGTRGFMAKRAGHDYLGVEIRKEEVDRILERQKELDVKFDIVCADSTEYIPDTEAYNFAYTCPPYYDLEQYSDLERDTSNADTYEEFLEMTKASLQHTYNALQSDSFAVWVVGNFRTKQGTLRHFNGDMVRLGQRVGFKLWDELIFWGASTVAAMRSGMFEANRKSIRVHESIIIFKK